MPVFTENKRSELPDSAFGIPSERKYPLDTKEHVLSAIKLFGHVEPKYEQELAKAIIKKMKEYNIPESAVGEKNKLRKYLKPVNESVLKSSIDKDYKPKGKLSLSSFKKQKLTPKNVEDNKHISKLFNSDAFDLKVDAAEGFFDGDKLVCYCVVNRENDGLIWLDELEVLPDYQGYGLSKQLLDYAVRHLRVQMLGVEKDNAVAIRLYENYGFRKTEESVARVKKGTLSFYRMYLPSAIDPATIEQIYGTLISEAIVTNDEDIYYNKDKFDSGEINLCWITGHSGSGKSTMGRSMADDNTEFYELDDLWNNKNNFTMDELKEYGGLFYGFFNGPGKRFYLTTAEIGETDEFKEEAAYEKKLFKAFLKYAKTYAKSHPKTKFICDGIWVYMFMEPSELEDCAVYIKGTSALISNIRQIKRDNKDLSDRIKKMASVSKWKYYLIEESHIKKFRDYFSKRSVNEACKDLVTARHLVQDVQKLAKRYNANFFFVTDGASGTSNGNGGSNEAVRACRRFMETWEKEHGYDPDEDWTDDPSDTSRYRLNESSDKSDTKIGFKSNKTQSFKFINITDDRTDDFIGIDFIGWETAAHRKSCIRAMNGTIAVDSKGDPAGCVFVYKNSTKWGGCINGLHVIPKYRGQKLGKELLHKAIFMGGNHLYVFADNKVAIKMYKKAGFEITEKGKDEDGERCYTMTLKEKKDKFFKESIEPDTEEINPEETPEEVEEDVIVNGKIKIKKKVFGRNRAKKIKMTKHVIGEGVSNLGNDIGATHTSLVDCLKAGKNEHLVEAVKKCKSPRDLRELKVDIMNANKELVELANNISRKDSSASSYITAGIKPEHVKRYYGWLKGALLAKVDSRISALSRAGVREAAGPKVCPKCGGEVHLILAGEPIYKCTKCNKYLGTRNPDGSITEQSEGHYITKDVFGTPIRYNPEVYNSYRAYHEYLSPATLTWNEDSFYGNVDEALYETGLDHVEYHIYTNMGPGVNKYLGKVRITEDGYKWVSTPSNFPMLSNLIEMNMASIAPVVGSGNVYIHQCMLKNTFVEDEEDPPVEYIVSRDGMTDMFRLVDGRKEKYRKDELATKFNIQETYRYIGEVAPEDYFRLIGESDTGRDFYERIVKLDPKEDIRLDPRFEKEVDFMTELALIRARVSNELKFTSGSTISVMERSVMNLESMLIESPLAYGYVDKMGGAINDKPSTIEYRDGLNESAISKLQSMGRGYRHTTAVIDTSVSDEKPDILGDRMMNAVDSMMKSLRSLH